MSCCECLGTVMCERGLLVFLLFFFLAPLGSTSNDGSYRLKAGHRGQPDVSPTSNIELWCNVTNPGAAIKSCRWISPNEDVFYVVGGNVTSGPGSNASDNVVGNVTKTECNITVLRANESDMGDWRCRVRHSASRMFQEVVVPVVESSPSSPGRRVKDIRLPGDIIPMNYDLKLIPFIQGNLTIDGSVVITAKVVQPTKIITVHIKDIGIDEDSVRVEGRRPRHRRKRSKGRTMEFPVDGNRYDDGREFYQVVLRERVPTGKVVISMDFKGVISDGLTGMYKSKYVNGKNETVFLATTKFEPTDARRAFPCFDEPALKATFKITLGRLPSMNSLSNMPIEKKGVPSGKGEYVLDVYQETVKMPTYLLAMIVSDFVPAKSPRLGDDDQAVEFKIWSRRNAHRQTKFAAAIGPKILKHYEEFFNVDYPLPKQDMIAIPDFASGAMENWGLITYRETALLYEEGVSSLASKKRVAHVVAHELAHQWFGNLVTMKWWTDLWLNEGFASYVEYIGADVAYPEAKNKEHFVIDEIHNTFEDDALESSHPISVEVNHPDEISEIFDSISYQKGASIIRMITNFLTEASFRKGITTYLKRFRYSNAAQADLWQALTEAAQEDGTIEEGLTVQDIMDAWTTKMGYPVVEVRANRTHFQCRQERFLLPKLEGNLSSVRPRQNSQNDTTVYEWYIPLSYTVAGGKFDSSATKTRHWLRPGDKGFHAFKLDKPTKEDGPLVVNVQQTGFFRVNYDEDNWLEISRVLKKDHRRIGVTNRAQILNDALSLARAGLLSYDVALAQTEYLSEEADFIPWASAKQLLKYLAMMMRRTETWPLLAAHITKLMDPVYKKVGFKPNRSDDDFLKVQLRKLIVQFLCDIDHNDCVKKAANSFKDWMSAREPDEDNPVPTDLKFVVYCTGVRKGGDEEWNFLWERFAKTNNGHEKAAILTALGCSGNAKTLQAYLEKMVDPNSGVRKQDVRRALAGISIFPVGQDLAWNWLSTNFAKISEYLGNGQLRYFGRMVRAATFDYNSAEKLGQLVDFRKANEESLGKGLRGTDVAIRHTEANVVWRGKYYAQVAEWLASKYNKTGIK